MGSAVRPSGAAIAGGRGAAVRGADAIRPASPDPLPTPEGHEDTNPNYDRVRQQERDKS